MAKLKSTGIKKIDLSEIILKDNIRKDYSDIEELAGSIERDGQLQPIIISPDYELIAGYRRFKAHEYLMTQGKPFNQIEAIIRTGEAYILQLTENIHRDNLNPAELEQALKKMIETGLTQSQIATRLNKRISWISDALAAGAVRGKVKTDTSGISTSAMSQLRGVDDEDLTFVVKETKKNGGTVKAAKAAKDKVVHKSVDNVDKSDPFEPLKGEIRKLLRLDYDSQDILNCIEKLLEGLNK
jgi:ParB/RepB/Spo0J family partition protein